MWLPDYVLLLNKFGGILISTEKVTLLSIPPITWEHFLLISTTHLRSRTRVTTCFLNLFLARLDCFSPKKISELIQKKSISIDSAVLAALAFKAVTHLKNQPGDNATMLGFYISYCYAYKSNKCFLKISNSEERIFLMFLY